MTKQPTKSVRFTAYALFGLLLFIVIVLAAELYARNQAEYGRAGFVFSEKLIYHLSPKMTAEKAYAWGKVGKPPFTLTFNEQGFRGPDFTPAPPEGVKRVLVLGDSYTAGLDYPWEVSYVGQWQRMLNANGGQQYELLNVSCPAWGTDQQYLFWQTMGRKLQADHVVVLTSPNDAREAWNHKMVYYDEEMGRLATRDPVTKISRRERRGWKWASRSSLYQLLQKKVFKTNYGEFARVFWYFPVNYGVEDSTDWDRPLFLKQSLAVVDTSYRLLEQMYADVAKDAAAQGAQFHLVKIPIRTEFDSTYADTSLFHPQIVEQRMTAMSRRNGWNFVNLNAALREHPDFQDIFMDWEYHYDEDGHNWMAEQLYEKVQF
ncbi:MAG: SGNH/GDSL hydrolase family protein [Bacteroidota bacterium]